MFDVDAARSFAHHLATDPGCFRDKNKQITVDLGRTPKTIPLFFFRGTDMPVFGILPGSGMGPF